MLKEELRREKTTTTCWNTQSDWVKRFKDLELQKFEALMIYSDLEAFNPTIGGAQTIIEALYEVVGYQATLILPAHRLNQTCPSFFEETLDPQTYECWKREYPAYDPQLSAIESDELARVFARISHSHRSSHPVASFIGVGCKADWYLSKHDLSSMFGEASPLQKLYAQDAKVLCLGTTYQQLTALHLAEYFAMNRPTRLHEAVIQSQGKRTWTQFEDLDLDASIFDEIGQAYEQAHDVQVTLIGAAECRVLDYRSLIDFATQYLNQRPTKKSEN